MEARTTLRTFRLSRPMVTALVAIVVAFLLGGAGGYLFKSQNLPVTTTSPRVDVVTYPSPSPRRTILPNSA
jgi:hypothetical protein